MWSSNLEWTPCNTVKSLKKCGGSFFVRKPNPEIYILGEKFLLKLKIDAFTNKPITCNSQKMASTESNDSTAYMDHTEEVFSSVWITEMFLVIELMLSKAATGKRSCLFNCYFFLKKVVTLFNKIYNIILIQTIFLHGKKGNKKN